MKTCTLCCFVVVVVFSFDFFVCYFCVFFAFNFYVDIYISVYCRVVWYVYPYCLQFLLARWTHDYHSVTEANSTNIPPSFPLITCFISQYPKTYSTTKFAGDIIILCSCWLYWCWITLVIGDCLRCHIIDPYSKVIITKWNLAILGP